MAGSVNKVILVGNLGRDPEIRSMPSGDKVANFSIATSENWKDKQTGERRERTEWHRVVVFGGLVRIIEQYVHKGSQIYIEGQLQTRKWTDQQGQERYSTEVVLQGFNSNLTLLGRRGEGGGGGGDSGYADDPGPGSDQGGGTQNTGSGGDSGSSGGPGPGRGDDLDDEIPF